MMKDATIAVCGLKRNHSRILAASQGLIEKVAKAKVGMLRAYMIANVEFQGKRMIWILYY